MFVLSTFFIGVSSTSTYYISYLLAQIWDCGNYCYCVFLEFTGTFVFRARSSLSPFFQPLLFLSTILPMSIQVYHSLILLLNTSEKYSDSISFYLIILFIPHLNSSTNSLSSYPLSLAILLNFCTNSSIIFSSYSTFIILSSPLPNSCFKSVTNPPTIVNMRLPFSKSSIMFSFHISTNLFYTYDNTYCTCSSTNTSPIFILMYNLYTIKNPDILFVIPPNICGLATFIFDLVLGWGTFAAITPFTYLANNAWICICIAANYSYYCFIICSQLIELYWLIL